jgi:release factor glutamine methyltransferase
MGEIYQPAEDSFLLAKFVKKELTKNKVIEVLDMGSGSGIQAEVAIKAGINPENIILADINPEAIKHLKKKFPECKVILSDLFSKISKKFQFDLITFNPPYLPNNKFDKEPDTSGGKKGSEIINKFLSHAKKYLSKNRIIVLLTSSFTKGIDWADYEKKLLGKKKIFFEELYVWKLRNK